MLDLIRNTPLTDSQSRTSRLTIEKLQDNATNEPRIQISTYNYQFQCTDWSNQITTAWTYIGYQALSKLLTKSLYIASSTVRGKDEQLDKDMDWLINSQTNEHYNIQFIAIAQSNFNRPVIKRARERCNPINSREDEVIQEYTKNAVLGVTQTEHGLMLFYNISKRMDTCNQLRLLTLIYRNIPRLVIRDVDKEETFFRRLSEYFINTNTGAIADTPDLSLLKAIFIDYCDGQKEYIIDNTDRIVRIIRKRRKEQLSIYEARVDSARRNVQDNFNKLINSQRTLNEANELYTAMLATTTDNLEQDINEAIELLKRSPIVTAYGFDGMKLWFRVHQPLYVNDKTGWERVSNNLLTGINKECVNKALIDEEFELWTECTIAFDFQYIAISKYIKDTPVSRNAIPQPHIIGYNCFGQHLTVIARLLGNGDIVGAIEQAIEAAAGMNYADGPVVNKFAYYVKSMTDVPFFKKGNEWFSIIDYTEKKIRSEQNAVIETETDPDNQPLG